MSRALGALLAAVTLAACGGGGGGAPSPRPSASASVDDAIPGAATFSVDSISVHTLAWLSDDEVATVEFPDSSTKSRTTTWLVVNVRAGTVRRITPPPADRCPDATATGLARIRDGVVAYVEHCPDPKRSRVLSYDVATGRATPLVDAGPLSLEHVTVDASGKPAYVSDLTGSCAGMAKVAGGAVSAQPLTVPDPRVAWDAAAPLRSGADCARTGRAGFPRIDRAGKRLAFVGSPPGTRTTRLYVSPTARFAPAIVGPVLASPADVTWARSGTALYVTSRDGDLMGLARIDVATGAATRLYDRSVLSLALSPDGTRLAVLRPRPTTTQLNVLPV